MKEELKKAYGLDLIEDHKSPFSGRGVIPRSMRWWKKANIPFAEVKHENEEYIEFSVRYLIKKVPEPRPRLCDEDELIRIREKNLGKLK